MNRLFAKLLRHLLHNEAMKRMDYGWRFWINRETAFYAFSGLLWFSGMIALGVLLGVAAAQDKPLCGRGDSAAAYDPRLCREESAVAVRYWYTLKSRSAHPFSVPPESLQVILARYSPAAGIVGVKYRTVRLPNPASSVLVVTVLLLSLVVVTAQAPFGWYGL